MNVWKCNENKIPFCWKKAPIITHYTAHKVGMFSLASRVSAAIAIVVDVLCLIGWTLQKYF